MKLYFSGLQKPEDTKSLKLETWFLNEELKPFEFKDFTSMMHQSDLRKTMIITMKVSGRKNTVGLWGFFC